MAFDPESANRRSKRIWWGIAVFALMALALFLRAYWNVDAAVAEEGFRLASGSDPYYHKRAIDYIQDNGWSTLIRDPLLNYPYGSVNPNPPLFQWSVAVSGLALAPFFGGDLATATWWAMLWNPAVMGALTVLPIYVLGAELFNRKTGLLAGAFWALSTASMDHTALGASDHDAFYMFFLVTGFAFYVKYIHAIRGDAPWVRDWRDGSSVARGLGAFFRERKVALGYAVLAGVSLAAVALTWKGFPYATGIVFAFAGLQLVLDHWRNRDSLGLAVGTLAVLGLPVLLATPYYAAAGVLGFLQPGAYIFAAFLVGSAVLVPTRDLPSILVLPAAALAGLVLVALTFVIPALEGVRVQLLYATVYFKQSRLYTTIAEAHPASFDQIVFGIGPVVFLVGVVALAMLPFTARRDPRRDKLFTFVWGLIAIYMAASAVRFLFNAVPVFALLGGWLIARAIDWFDFPALWRGRHAAGAWAGARRGFSVWHAVGAVAIALLVVAPSVLLAVDAAVPGEVENKWVEESGADSFAGQFVSKRLGAFTQGYFPDYWHQGLTWLDRHDAHIEDPADRPAFLAWWDYGHWAIAVGKHPATADNFQNGYVHAGNFLTALNETHAVQLLAARQLERGAVDAATAKELLAEVGVQDVDTAYAQMKAFEYAPAVDLDKAVAFVAKVEETTGHKIRYVAADVRMLEYDSPQTPYIDNSGIFYAPIYLAEKDAKDFFETRYRGNDGGDYSEEEAEHRIRQSQMGIGPPNFQIVSTAYQYHEPFFESMYWRTFVGNPPRGQAPYSGEVLDEALAAPQPAFGLQHFRLVYANEALRILEYYPGATVSGRVVMDGEPVEGAVVSVLDDAGDLVHPHVAPGLRSQIQDPAQLDIPHDRDATGADGRFTVTAPFGMDRGVTFVAALDGVEIGRETIQITREQAQGQDLGELVTFEVETGAVEGLAFVDANGNGTYEADVDRPAAGVNLTIGGAGTTTGADGRYRVDGVSPGARAVATDDPAYEVAAATRTAVVRSNETTEHDVALAFRSVPVTGGFGFDQDGDGAIGPDEKITETEFVFRPDPEVADNTAVELRAITNANGTFAERVTPGAYLVEATYTGPDGATYALTDRFTVPAGAASFERDFVLARQA